MFKRKTLFVVGAGASKELGMPLGTELADSIAKLFTYKTQFDKWSDGDTDFLDAYSRHFARTRNDHLAAGRTIAEGIRHVRSIDNYIDTHKDKQIIAEAGKAAIAYAILQAEANSKVRLDDNLETRIKLDFTKTKGTWLPEFASMVQEGVSAEGINSIFHNVSVICFNYDRCIEHFMAHWLEAVYGLKPDDAMAHVAKLLILRPYGRCGQLLAPSEEETVPFGTRPDRANLSTLRAGLKTYTEQIEDMDVLSDIRHEMAEAEVIVFLGFGFHPQNMRLLQPARSMRALRVIASAYQESNENRNSIQRELVKLVYHDDKQRRADKPDVQVRDLSAHGILTSFRRDILANDL